MKKYMEVIKTANVWILLTAAFLLAALLELCVFQFSYFSQNFGDYNRTELDLSQMTGYNGEALPLLPDNPTVSFDGLSQQVRTFNTTGKIQDLRQQVASGEYRPDARETAARMLLSEGE